MPWVSWDHPEADRRSRVHVRRSRRSMWTVCGARIPDAARSLQLGTVGHLVKHPDLPKCHRCLPAWDPIRRKSRLSGDSTALGGR